MPSTRQLAAIMFTDIVGYTALMGKDEQKAFELLNKNRQIQRPIIEAFGGKWIKELGDGVLASFPTVSDAVNAAIKIQQTCHIAKEFQLRIGIHSGEVVFENDDVFGDGVNIASRIQALAPPGSVWISETVQQNIANKKEFQTGFVKAEKLKNVADPIRIYQVKAEGITFLENINPVPAPDRVKKKSQKFMIGMLGILGLIVAIFFTYQFFLKNTGKSTSNGSTAGQSIAVLPFVNMSNDPEQEYFSDGLSEELLNKLTNVPDLKVISRTSSFSFKGKNEDVRKIGEALGAGNILEGSVRKSGTMIRITAQLIEAKNGTHLWSEAYDRQMSDLFTIQDEISRMIVSILKIKLLDEPAKRIAKHHTENPEAHEDYLKGRYFWNQRTEESLRKAREYFENAIRKDPNYAMAYSGLSDTYITLFDYEILSFEESTAKAKEAALKALEIDKDLAEANNSLAHISLHEWHWKEAEEGFRRALNLDPGYVLAHHWYALCLTALGRLEEAVDQMNIAKELDPLSVRINADLGMAYLASGKYDEAIKQEEKTLKLNPNAAVAFWIRGMSFQQKKMFDEAVNDFQHALSIYPGDPNFISSLGNVYAAMGNSEKAHQCLDSLMVQNKQYPTSFSIALVFAGLNDKANAFQWLEKAFEERSGSIRYLKAEPRLRNLKEDPRYSTLMKKVGLPE